MCISKTHVTQKNRMKTIVTFFPINMCMSPNGGNCKGQVKKHPQCPLNRLFSYVKQRTNKAIRTIEQVNNNSHSQSAICVTNNKD